MMKEQLREKYTHWAERIGYTAFENDLENATLLLSYDDKRTGNTFTGVSVYAIAVHTNRVHLFLYTVRTTWRLDERGDTEGTLEEEYRLIIAI